MNFDNKYKKIQKNYKKNESESIIEKSLIENLRKMIKSYNCSDEEIKDLYNNCLKSQEKEENSILRRLAIKYIERNLEARKTYEMVFGGTAVASMSLLGLTTCIFLSLGETAGLVFGGATLTASVVAAINASNISKKIFELKNKKLISKKIVSNSNKKISQLKKLQQVMKRDASNFRDLEL